MSFITPRRADFWRPWLVAALLCVPAIAFFTGHAHARLLRASFYDQGSVTASGARFDWRAMTAASRNLAFGTRVRLCLDGCAIATITDRGPFVRGRDMDVSRGVARRIGLERRGVALIRAEILRAEVLGTTHRRHRTVITDLLGDKP